MAPLAIVANSATIWRRLHVPTSIGSKVGHQVGPLELPHCLELSDWQFNAIWHYLSVLSWYLYQPESYQLIFHKVSQIGPGDLDPIKMAKNKKCPTFLLCIGDDALTLVVVPLYCADLS